LPRALNSVTGQTLKPNEIILVDDGSTDQTASLARQRYPDVTLLQQNNQGVSSARNAGIRHATGEWIALLDSDDEWLPSKLEKQFQALQKQPQHLLCHTDEIWIRNGRRVNPMNKHQKHGGHIFQKCLPLCAISPSSVLIHKTLLDDVGLFDETLPACEDYDLWLRICATYPVLFLDEQLINKYGGHDDQLSRKHWGMDRFRVLALEKIIDSNRLNAEDKQAAIDVLSEKCRIFAQGATKRDNPKLADEYRQLAGRYNLNNHTPGLPEKRTTAGNRS
jgi:glycosyltransferase involved in cell wall biosynthesis